MTQRTSSLERTLRRCLGGFAHVATGLSCRLNDATYGTRGHSCHICP